MSRCQPVGQCPHGGLHQRLHTMRHQPPCEEVHEWFCALRHRAETRDSATGAATKNIAIVDGA